MGTKVYREADLAAARHQADWGSLGWMTGPHSGVQGLTMGRVTIRAGKSNPEHMHATCDEILYLLAGRLRHMLGDDEVILEAGDAIEIPRNTRHRAWSVGETDADMIVVYNSSDRDFKATNTTDLFVASPMCFPRDDLPTVLARFQRLGFTRIEAFTKGPASAIDPAGSADEYRALAASFGLSFHSMHLPVIDSSDPDSLSRARAALDFVACLGAPIALYKAASITDYIAHAPAMLDRAETAGVTLVIQNHAGSVLATDDDIAAVIDGVADERLRVLLEVGHYEKVGIPWSKPFARFRDQISYCHVKDMVGERSVVFGTGHVNLHELFLQMGEIEYANGYVLELEARDLADDARKMEEGLRDSLRALEQILAR